LYDYYGFIQIYSHLLARTGWIFGESIAFPESIFRRIPEEGVTDLVLVPHTLRELLKLAVGKRREALQSLQFMTSSSDMLTPELLKKAFEVNPALTIVNIYGLTEAGRACYRKIGAASESSNAIGRPAPGVEIVIDSPAGTEPGEIIIRGPNVMRGYFRGLQGDRIIFDPCSEMRTGDLGRIDERGEIVLLGRRDHMFNINGDKIHPVEIEQVALRAPGVADAQARTAAGPGGEVVIILDVVPTENGFDLEQVRSHVRKNLSPSFFPREFNVVTAVKRTELGSKIIRRPAPV
jgi:acyl-CoA synthetase (AMP-forming)/AMP-acid ligase II